MMMVHNTLLSNLEQKIDVTDIKSQSNHQEILSVLSDSVTDTGLKKAPSLKVALYGINRITYPTMLWENTPELLDLFSLSELYRQKIVSNCLEVLHWNDFYIKEDASDAVDGVPLFKEDISLLGRILRKAQNKVLRETYRSIVLQICASHIYHLRQSNQTLLIPVFFMRYFPSPEDLSLEDESPHLPIWLRGLTISELEQLKAIRLNVIKALEEMQIWEDQQENSSGAEGLSKFPLLIKWSEVAALLCRHTAKVQTLIGKLESIF